MNTATRPDASHIAVRGDRVVAYVGKDATHLFRAITLKSALNLYARCGMLTTRNATPKVMLAIAKEYTGKDYKGKDKYLQAAEGVRVWIETMRAALPIVDEAAK